MQKSRVARIQAFTFIIITVTLAPLRRSVYGQREATGQHGATAPPLTLVPRPSHPPGVAWWLAYAEGALEHSNNKGRKKDVSGGSVESVHVVGAVSKHEGVGDADTQTHSTQARAQHARERGETHGAGTHRHTRAARGRTRAAHDAPTLLRRGLGARPGRTQGARQQGTRKSRHREGVRPIGTRYMQPIGVRYEGGVHAQGGSMHARHAHEEPAPADGGMPGWNFVHARPSAHTCAFDMKSRQISRPRRTASAATQSERTQRAKPRHERVGSARAGSSCGGNGSTTRPASAA